MEKIKVKLECQYNGHSIKKNGSVDLSFKVPYSELVNAMEMLQLLHCNITIKAKIGVKSKEIILLGTFYLQKANFDREGECTLGFNSELESVEIDNFSSLLERETIINLLCSGMIEKEDDEEVEE